MHRKRFVMCLSLVCLLLAPSGSSFANVPREVTQRVPNTVIIDTDIGDDIDDAYALALALRAPELNIEAITTSFGDTRLRARLTRRFLHEAGRDEITVAAGPATRGAAPFTQHDWASAEPAKPVPDAVTLLLDRLRAAPPGTITLLALAPLTTIRAAMARDPTAFARLREVVLMAGSIRRGYGRIPGTTSPRPSLEYNANRDPKGLRLLLAGSVPVVLMPIDASELALSSADRRKIFAEPGKLPAALAALYAEWAPRNRWGPTPVLFDAIPVAWLLDQAVCRPQALRLDVDADGMTREVPGTPNVHACLDVDRARVRRLLLQRVQSE